MPVILQMKILFYCTFFLFFFCLIIILEKKDLFFYLWIFVWKIRKRIVYKTLLFIKNVKTTYRLRLRFLIIFFSAMCTYDFTKKHAQMKTKSNKLHRLSLIAVNLSLLLNGNFLYLEIFFIFVYRGLSNLDMYKS